MLTYQSYVAGWIDGSVAGFFEEFPRRSAGLKYALITTLDSDPRPASLLARRDALTSIRREATKLGTGILLPTAALLKDDAYREIFYGFDEVWFFPDRPLQPKPPNVSFVGPRRIEKARLEKAGPWMTAQSSSLAIADGDGLNFIVKVRGLVKYFLGHSGEAPLIAGVAEPASAIS